MLVFALFALLAADQPADDGLVEKSREFLARMVAGKMEEAVAPFDATMREKMPAADLTKIWEQLRTLHGDFRGAPQVRREKFQKYRLVFLTLEFQRGKLEMKVVWDEADKIAGLFVLPAGKYESPKYADPTKFESREVTIGRGLLNLPGSLTTPPGVGPFPAVVLIHGSGPHDRDETIGPNKPFRDLAEGLASRGIAVLRFEKRTKAHPLDPVFLSGKITVKEETIDDAVAAFAVASQDSVVDSRRIFVLGHSLGGMLIPRLAQRLPEARGFISLAGSTRPLEDSVLMQVKYLTALDGKVDADETKAIAEIEKQVALVKSKELDAATPATGLPLGIPPAYWLDLRGYEPGEEAKRIKKPMLFLQGERDYQVTLDDFAGWKKPLADRGDVVFKTYPQLNHLFHSGEGKSTPGEYAQAGHIEEEVVRDIAEWVGKLR